MINWETIAAMLVSSPLTEWDREAVATSVEKAVTTWVEPDMETYTVVAVELDATEWFPAKIDLVLRDKRLRAVDWKTKKAGSLDEVWQMRETRSPQRKLYAAALATKYGPDIFPVAYEVRGIRLDEHKPATKTLVSDITAAEAEEAVRHIKDKSALRDLLIERGAYPWIRVEDSCRRYGPQYPCPGERFCWGGQTVPPTDLLAVSDTLSHSSAKDFMHCPEYYRLRKSVPNLNDRDDDQAGPGKVFHEIMERIYLDIQGIKA
jgi:hypothetical protein